MRTVPVNTFLVDAARRVFINPRTNRPGLPVSEFPRVLLGSSVTLRFDLVAGGRPFEVPAGQGVVASLGYLDGRGRPFYTAQAARVDGSASSFDVGFDFTGADKARLRPGALWFMLRAGDRNILKDSGRLDPGPWPSPLPPTPYQETHIPSEGSEVLRLRPTPTLFLLGTLEDGTARTVELDADALADGRLYECNRVLFKGAAGASLLFDGADRQPGETPQAGWRTYMISRYPDGTLAVDTQTGDSAYEVWLDGLPEGAPSSPGDYLAFLKGEKGDPNTLSIGTVVTDEIPSATITGEAPNQTLNLVLPKGDKGDPNTLSIGTVLKGDDAAATITGTAPNQTLNLTLPKGDPNTLSIGTVTQADTPAATITGEAPNQTLNLVLPKGDKGDTGLSSYEDWLDEGHEGTREDYLEWLQDGAGEKIEAQCRAIYDSIVAISTFEVGPALNYGLTQDGNLLSFTWMDPADFISESLATIAYWGRTRLIMKLGGFPEHEEDGTILVDNTVRDQYRETPFVYDTAGLSGYYFALFTQTTGGIWNTSDKAPRFTTDDLTWQAIVMMTRAGTLLDYPGMDYGAVVDIQVNTLYPELRYRLAHIDYDGGFPEPKDWHYDKTKLRNSVWIPYLLPCLGDSNDAAMMPFDAPENAYGKTWDEVFITGKAYYTVSGETYTQLTAGTDYQDGESVADWQTLHGDTVYTKNHSDRVSKGNNIWKESNMRQWLNSSGNDWFVKQNEYDVKSGNTDYRSGWMTGFVSGFLDLVMPVYNKTARNTVSTISGGGGGGYDITLDKIWLPSIKEVFGTNNNNIAEGAQFDYFRDVATTNAQRIQYDEGGTARYVWLRSPNTGTVYGESNINTGGASNNSHAVHNSYALLPAMCIA